MEVKARKSMYFLNRRSPLKSVLKMCLLHRAGAETRGKAKPGWMALSSPSAGGWNAPPPLLLGPLPEPMRVLTLLSVPVHAHGLHADLFHSFIIIYYR